MNPQDFRRERARLGELALEQANLDIKRIFAMDAAAYREGYLDVKTKELLGLVASLVLRCDDCIYYHLDQCKYVGVKQEELIEVMQIALVVGGSIVIPHYRRAMDYWLGLAES